MIQYISKKYFKEVNVLLRFNSKGVLDTENIAEKLGRILKSGDVVAYFGGLGMGKTAFTRGLAKGMGITADVSSPTFAIVNDYGGNPPLVHFDMYKVDSWDDLYSSGFFDYYDMGAILCTEWSENIESSLPERYVKVEIIKDSQANPDSRTITSCGIGF